MLEEPTVPAPIVTGTVPPCPTAADAIACASETSISLFAAMTLARVAASSGADPPDP
ncbi:MAG: hypothetical protein J2P22_08385 [Nocardioides sp.]|nr:hypothetical protein [Nocardioides sp.]